MTAASTLERSVREGWSRAVGAVRGGAMRVLVCWEPRVWDWWVDRVDWSVEGEGRSPSLARGRSISGWRLPSAIDLITERDWESRNSCELWGEGMNPEISPGRKIGKFSTGWEGMAGDGGDM